MAHCNNCKAQYQGKYCSNCGQKAGIGRLHMHDIAHEIWHALTHADKGILKLVKGLILNPHSTYQQYFEGQRKNYFSPVLFYVLTAGVSIYLGDHIFEYENQVNGMNNEFGRFVLNYTKLLGLILLPIEALLTWSMFHKRYNLAECAVFWLFCNGLVFLFRIALTPIYIPLIWHKSALDYVIRMVGSLIFLWQLITVFAWKRSWKIYLLCFALINLLNVISQLTIYYLFLEDPNSPQSIWQIIKSAYLI